MLLRDLRLEDEGSNHQGILNERASKIDPATTSAPR